MEMGTGKNHCYSTDSSPVRFTEFYKLSHALVPHCSQVLFNILGLNSYIPIYGLSNKHQQYIN